MHSSKSTLLGPILFNRLVSQSSGTLLELSYSKPKHNSSAIETRLFTQIRLNGTDSDATRIHQTSTYVAQLWG
ncbi:hypothetical protein C8Q75DRAFT_789085 [Abortiporus biennis]|nr:hypothetical protein C8Q75DRAFT_789085 [Abortiporus biennis]